MKFDDYRIHPKIRENLRQLEWKRPTDIQFKAIPSILKGEDVLAIAQTGTGKTAAFAIPVVHLLAEKRPFFDSPRCLVLAPTRELALQTTQVFEKIAAATGVKIHCIFGGVEQDSQIQKLEKGVDIVVATPGRMFDLRAQGHLDLTKIEILVVDEADQMMDLGFIRDLEDLQKHLPRRRQTLFFSATIHEKIKKIAYSLVRDAIRIQISPKDPVSKNVLHSVAFIEMDDKRFFLAQLVEEHPDSKILVFVRTKVRAERVAKALERAEVASVTMHGDKSQSERLDTLKKFRAGEAKVLIATDLNARGIDIPDVEMVVNYDLPEVAENYVHRVGRTGRGEKKGRAVSFCSEEERPVLVEIEAFLGKKISVLEIDRSTYATTLALHDDRPYRFSELEKEIEEAENWSKKKRKKVG